jgi:uncharacterized protein involved in exopolysaccharide biosynthesis
MMEHHIKIGTLANVREEYAFKVISPAIPSDEDRFVKPRRSFVIVLGAVVGIALGVFLAFLLFAVKRIRADLARS